LDSKPLKELLHIDRTIVCNKKGQIASFMACPTCDYYACNQLTDDMITELNCSPFMDRTVKRLVPRRCKLYIIKYLDGTLKEAPELDPNHPDRELMKDVDTVFQIGKELVPVIVLKPKPKEEREDIVKNIEAKAKKKVIK